MTQLVSEKAQHQLELLFIYIIVHLSPSLDVSSMSAGTTSAYSPVLTHCPAHDWLPIKICYVNTANSNNLGTNCLLLNIFNFQELY